MKERKVILTVELLTDTSVKELKEEIKETYLKELIQVQVNVVKQEK
jgi:hypothetical protein